MTIKNTGSKGSILECEVVNTKNNNQQYTFKANKR